MTLAITWMLLTESGSLLAGDAADDGFRSELPTLGLPQRVHHILLYPRLTTSMIAAQASQAIVL